MTDQPDSGASDSAAAPAAGGGASEPAAAPAAGQTAAAADGSAPGQQPADAPHRNRILIGTLFTLATIVGVVAVLAVWVNRQALSTSNWTNTSTQLLQDKKIQTAVAAYAVNALFSSGAVQSEIKSVLPSPFQAVAGPLSSGLEQLANTAAPKILASSQVQNLWREANQSAHATLLKIINGGGKLATTNGGVVTLNLHAIVDQLASYLGVQSQVNAARSKLNSNRGTVTSAAGQIGITLPPSSGMLVIMRSDQLSTVQDIAKAIKGLSIILPILSFALFILAVYLSRGHRREAFRMTGWCFVGVGLLVLIARRLAGNDVVDALVKNPANRPAAHDAWTIATTLLYDIGVALIAYGLVFVVCAWLAGRTRPATALRRAMAPTLRTRPASGYIAAYILLLLVILWGPTPATRQLPYIIGFIVLIAIGVNALRRQTEREFPEAQPGETMSSVRALYGSRPGRATAPAPAAANGGRVAELERLASLHDSGVLTDDEFAAEKAVIMSGS